MKAWWRIGNKPRGRWLPLLEWGVNLSPPEQEEMENLNVNSVIRYCLHGGAQPHPSCKTDRILAFLPRERLIHPSCAKVGEKEQYLGYDTYCSDCPRLPSTLPEWHLSGAWDLKSEQQRARLPWRPGARPDYADFIDPLREFLYRVMEELERRFVEARESAPSDEWMLEEEFDSFSWHTEKNGVETAERKLRVIRR